MSGELIARLKELAHGRLYGGTFAEAVAEIASLQQQLSDCKSSLREMEAERDQWRQCFNNNAANTARAIARAEAADAREKQVRAAAERVMWFDWSGNDSGAVAAIYDLRRALASKEGGK